MQKELVNDRLAELLKDELLEGEHVVWSGQPNPKTWICGSNLSQLFIMLIIVGSSISVLIGQIYQGKSLFSVEGVVVFGFAVLLGGGIMAQLISGQLKKRKTHYVLTNQRAISLFDSSVMEFRERFLKQVPNVSKSIRKSGEGNLYFGDHPGRGAGFIYPTGVPYTDKGYLVSFFDVSAAGALFELVKKIRETPER